MSLVETIERASAEGRFPPGALVVLGGEVESVPPSRLLAAPLPGERALLVPAHRDAWSVAGIGATARVSCDGGVARFARARDRARALFASMIRFEHAAEAPAPRLVGGFSFDAEPRREEPWEAFGAADFALPRWSYFAPPEGHDRGYLRLAVTPRELDGTKRLLAELSAIEATLAGGSPIHGGEGMGPEAVGSPIARRVDSDPSSNVRGRDDSTASDLAAPIAASPPGARIDDPAFASWEILVRAGLAAIADGTLQKVVPARRFPVAAAAPFDPMAVAPEPGTTSFRFDREGVTFVGRSPERLVQLAGGTVRCDALAGSIPRCGDDGAEATALLSSEKDLREHAWVVRGIIEELRRFAALSTVSRTPAVRTLRTIHHLYTQIEGTLLGTPHLFDLAAALHPTAAVAGRPRAAAMAFLAEREKLDRGWYAAPVGWVDAEGDGELWVALRSAAIRGSLAWAFAGAGVVEGSEPAAEWCETAVKAASILGALGVRP